MNKELIAEIDNIKSIPNIHTSVFEEIPVKLDDWLYDPAYLGIEKLSDKQHEVVRNGSSIYKTIDRKYIGESDIPLINELVIQWGKGSGKDYISAIISTTVLYRLLCLKSPLQYYNQSKSSHIDLLNMAYSESQAGQVFFSYLTRLMEESSWFKGKFKTRGASEIILKKGIRVFSGNSFEESCEGKNLFVCVLDEIAAFKTEDELIMFKNKRVRAPRWSAEAIYDMAQSSITSRFGKYGKLISISYPRYRGDFIQKLYEQRKEDHEAFVSFGATWEINPAVDKEMFSAEFRRNPERAKAKYECNPSAIIDSFMKKPELLDECFEKVEMEDIGLTDEPFPKILLNLRCNHNFACAIHVDIGWKKDSSGIACSHVYDVLKEEDNETGDFIELPLVEVDLVTSFMATRGNEIDFDTVRNFIVGLIGCGYNVKKISFDGYNSAYMLQIFNKMGIEAILRSVDRTTAAYDDLKDFIYCKRIKGKIANRTLWHLSVPTKKYIVLEELKGLVLIADKKVDHRHGFGFGKDEADALAGSVQGAVELGLTNFNVRQDITLGSDRQTFYEGGEKSNDREYLSPINELSW